MDLLQGGWDPGVAVLEGEGGTAGVIRLKIFVYTFYPFLSEKNVKVIQAG
jgi:hypothetical protein